MKTHLTLTAVSIAALMTAGVSLANDPHYQSEDPPVTKTGDIGKDAKAAWNNMKNDAAEAAENVEAVFIDEPTRAANATTFNKVTIDQRKTAAGMIGKPIYNTTNERVGTVKDVIMDSNGKASAVVVADGEFPGIDLKLAAFDYDTIVRRNVDGDVIMNLSEDMIDRATPFSYEPNSDERVRTLASGSISLAKVLDAQLLNEKNEAIAQVDNISIKNGQMDQLIVAFDQVLGLGGHKAAFQYKDAKIVRDGQDIDFQLSANQAAQFEAYKKAPK